MLFFFGPLLLVFFSIRLLSIPILYIFTSLIPSFASFTPIFTFLLPFFTSLLPLFTSLLPFFISLLPFFSYFPIFAVQSFSPIPLFTLFSSLFPFFPKTILLSFSPRQSPMACFLKVNLNWLNGRSASLTTFRIRLFCLFELSVCLCLLQVQVSDPITVWIIVVTVLFSALYICSQI